VLGNRHPSTAFSLNNLARLLKSDGEYAAARPLYEQSLEICRENFGDSHPSTALGQNNLALLLADLGERTLAENLSRQAARTTIEQLVETAAGQGGGGQRANAAAQRSLLDGWLSLATGPSAAPEALAWKGQVLARRIALAAVPETPATAAAKAELRQVSGRLAALAPAAPSDDETRTAWRAEVERLAAKRDSLERRIFAAGSAAAAVTDLDGLPAAVSAALPPETAAIDLHAYSHYVAAPERAAGRPKLERRVLGFIYRPTAEQPDGPVRVDLGPEEEIAELVERWRAVVTPRRPAPVEDVEKAGRALRAAIWEPLSSHLDGCDTVLISPDGPLCRLPFPALPGERPGSYLIEELAVAVVPVPRLLPLIVSARPAHADPGPVLALGGIDYANPANSAGVPATDLLVGGPDD
ncbi:MAG: tetratricopeptide repeat protein, partial [Planctomycetota bacterium]